MPDAVLDFLCATRERFQFRLGVAFRALLDPPPSPDPSLPARYLQIQVASPPPSRLDETTWYEGLRTSDGRPFDPGSPPADGIVTPLAGIAPLRLPPAGTIVLDRWVAVPAVTPTQALTRTFAFDPEHLARPPLHFLSAFYPGQQAGTVAGVAYYTQGDLVFDRPLDIDVDGPYFAVSLSRFFPPERPGADYIVQVMPPQKGTSGSRVVAASTFPVTHAWSAPPPPADVAVTA
jgi:hypothetical protein